ncbi:universal stress protein [Pediococcus acidilactici]|uniref:universal stress protein n=1 Tax=Pediococcus acidilactici TaxID=1254 RepID=UPI0013261077|nr:universal stress protein [Pediococcus acidilactici]KAF0338053.1 universal stress protein [Pediococcus acidilactici]KAF0378010.1 universal stress protein [Pediococcus acidilactici]KAF0388454.1 universal stress protein [Pediococcus acidilactici]KAF0450997.1 universal stress protein [Pediococcus acidilactici]KAF0460250.1 universal stress protein [Pediococcus acidilactici]
MAFDVKRILVGVDDSKDALLAFDYAINLAKDANRELVIVSVLENDEMNVFQALDKDYNHGERAELEQHILTYQKQAQDAGVTNVRCVVTEGDPGETIVEEVIPAVKPDLLVVGAESKKGIARRFGSQAAYMAKYAPITVTVVR